MVKVLIMQKRDKQSEKMSYVDVNNDDTRDFKVYLVIFRPAENLTINGLRFNNVDEWNNMQNDIFLVEDNSLYNKLMNNQK